jgi:hypothetical protein
VVCADARTPPADKGASMTPAPHPFVFGYFPRNKYKDLVFYVKTGEHSNYGLFEMPDTEENRALMEALASHSASSDVLDEFWERLYNGGAFAANTICDAKRIYDEFRQQTKVHP